MSEQQHAELGIHPVAMEDGDLLRRGQVVRRAKLLTVIVLVLLAVGGGRTLLSRISNAHALETRIAEGARLYVMVGSPLVGGAGQTVVLPGTLQGYVQSPIGARASGYLKRWYKDIGSRVEQGELLAEIDAPEIDQQLSQAVATREQVASSLALAQSSAARWEALRKKDAVSQQELDERRSADAQARSNLAAADAIVERVRQLAGFKRVVAPFAGIITKRNVDVGDLIEGTGRVMFLLAQADPLRVYVNVPQSYAQWVKPEMHVTVTQAELPGQRFDGKVARTAGSIDPATRTMQVEVQLSNRAGMLLPGAYVQVALPLHASAAMTISANTLLFRKEGVRVATVDGGRHVSLRTVKLGRNFGDTVEVLDGITAHDQLVLNPSDSLAEGDEVSIGAAPTSKLAQ